MFKKIKSGTYYFHDEYWSNTSPEAIDMIKRMLCVNQTNRWTARQLLQHPWILAGDEQLSSKDLSNVMTTMKKFNAKRRLKAAADAIIISNRIKNLTTFRPKLTVPIDPDEDQAGESSSGHISLPPL